VEGLVLNKNVLLAFLPLLFVVVAQAQTGTASLSGKMIVPESHFDSSFEVLLETTEVGGQVVTHTMTDSLGHYAFSGLSYGTYYVSAKLDGYQDIHEKVTLQPTQGVVFIPPIVNIMMVPRVLEPERSSSADSGAVSVGELGRTLPKKATEEYGKALQEIQKRNFMKAAERLEAAIKIAPLYYDAHFDLGAVYEKMNRTRDAEKEYRTAHDLRPQASRPLVNLGRLYVEESDAPSSAATNGVSGILVNARVALEEAIKLDPNSATACYLLGVTYYKSGAYDLAGEPLKRALTLDRNLSLARLVLANVYMRQKEWQDALDSLDAYLSANPTADNREEVAAMRLRVVKQLVSASN
jgi:Tfp pilus assembly protein PilF